MTPYHREPITPRPLSARERAWAREIMQHNPKWAGLELVDTHVVARCNCGECMTVYLESKVPQNPSLIGTQGYIGRIEIVTADDFMITISLDQHDGQLSELYVDALDLNEPGTRPLPASWQEKAHIVTSM